ncbi:MAG: hypothetical protein ACFCUM_19550 [Bacteroidales bacterium]
MIKKIPGLLITVIGASYIFYLGIEFRYTDYNIFFSMVFVSLFLYGLAGIDLIKTIRRNRKPK